MADKKPYDDARLDRVTSVLERLTGMPTDEAGGMADEILTALEDPEGGQSSPGPSDDAVQLKKERDRLRAYARRMKGNATEGSIAYLNAQAALDGPAGDS